jgi:phosphoglycerol transferase MdoB-like AlkP superfamily enzyme
MVGQIKNHAKKILIEETWITTKVLWTLYIFFNLWFLIKWRNYHEMLDPWNIFVHVIGLAFIYFYSETINKFVKKNFVRVFLGTFLIFLYFLLSKYRYRVRTGFDYSILHDNFWEMFNMKAMEVAAGTLKPKDFYQSIAMVPIMIAVQWKWKSFTKKVETSLTKASVYAAGLFALIAIAPIPFGEISYFAKTAWDFHFGGFPKTKLYEELNAKSFPFKREFTSTSEKVRPHIFIVNFESFNSLYVNKKANNGKYITPVFNELIKEGLFVEDFYGNSVQSIKGQFALLCSRIPLIRGKASYDIKDTKSLNCLPNILKDAGYYSMFHKCYSDLSFDNTGNFMSQIGFDKVAATDYGRVPKGKSWGWGAQDDVSYLQFAENADKIIKETGKPFFGIIHTVSHHMKFGAVPDRESHLFNGKAPSDKHDRFLNSLHTSDRYLGVFIEELKRRGLYENSIIVVTGDHSYPAGEHFLYDNQVSYFQEFFKTPLLVIWKNKLQPQYIKGKTYSHIDVVPTLMEMIGHSGTYNIMGNSILSNDSQYANLVQPYNGIYLSVVKWPYKYVWERRSNRDFLYNIEKDPHEENPIKDEKLIEQYRNQIGKTVYSHNKLYKVEKKSKKVSHIAVK